MDAFFLLNSCLSQLIEVGSGRRPDNLGYSFPPCQLNSIIGKISYCLKGTSTHLAIDVTGTAYV